MEANICDVNHLDASVLLPPRKRLLAGFKKQSSDADVLQPPVVASSSESPCPTCSPFSAEFQTRLNNLLSSHFNDMHNLSPGQIVEATRSAAETAVRAAEVARAAAQEKAVSAAKAVTAAKSALALVACFHDETTNKEPYLKKNKLKKHVQVQLLYKKHQPVDKYGDNEELARKLHRVMNSSPRISKNSSSSDGKGHSSKRFKSSLAAERTRISSGSVVFPESSPICNGQAAACEVDSGESIHKIYTSAGVVSEYEKTMNGEIENGEAESRGWKDRIGGEEGWPSRRRERAKIKTLALSN